MRRMYDILYKKRSGNALSDEEIRFFVSGYTNGEIPDEQAAALCMAICICGMDDRETAVLTDAMMRSGETVDLSHFGALSVDKHSTGGVGDKTTLIVAPLVASMGGTVAKMSGRGLGHTGGTVDKLESIAGYRTALSPEEFLSIAEKTGVCVVGQSGLLAPADKKLYALRDVTATVDCIPLIASSIMSKKLACGAHSIVLDVKAGSGAFMKTVPEAMRLAEKMVAVGNACGRRVCALITNMDLPLGSAVGNALEVKEAFRVLRGEQKGDLYEICISLASHMLSLCKGIPVEVAAEQAEYALESGLAFAKAKEWIQAQGGDVRVLDLPSLLPSAPYRYAVKAPQSGYLARMDTEGVGKTACLLGAGRVRKEDRIDLSAGMELLAKTGEFVECGQTIAWLYASQDSLFAPAEEQFLSSVSFSDQAVEPLPLLLGIVASED